MDRPFPGRFAHGGRGWIVRSQADIRSRRSGRGAAVRIVQRRRRRQDRLWHTLALGRNLTGELLHPFEASIQLPVVVSPLASVSGAKLRRITWRLPESLDLIRTGREVETVVASRRHAARSQSGTA